MTGLTRKSLAVALPVRTASGLLAPGGPISHMLQGAEVRPPQLAMADLVAEALLTPGRRLLVEAPTGTGKSLAYLCAAAMASFGETPLRVVVATGTKALQDQLITQDVPRLLGALQWAKLPLPTVEVVKGRQNYICKKRLGEWQPPLGLDLSTQRHIKLLRGWVDQTAVGDKSELNGVSEDSPLWGELDANADTCLGTACTHHDECFVTRLRARAREAHIIITNHHLLCADLRLRFLGGLAEARVLPSYNAVVLDEAHKLPGVAAEYFGMVVTPARVDALTRDCAAMALRSPGTGLRGATEALTRHAQLMFAAVGTAVAAAAEATRVALRLPDAPDALAAAEETLDAVEGVKIQVEAHAAQQPHLNPECEALVRRLSMFQEELGHLTAAKDDRFAYCAERRGTRGRLMAYPSDVAAVLQQTLFQGKEPLVFTSATLAVAGDFQAYLQDVGLCAEADTVQCVALPSTFGAHQAVLYVPRDLPDPGAANFTALAGQRALELVHLTGGGAFMLCTTVRAMNEMAKFLTSYLPGTLVLRQGDAPKGDLTARFKRDGHAVLVATHSYWEGVDVRGQALRLVMVDKLPFAPPSDPLVAARLQRCEHAGGNAFRDVSLADAVLLLRQGLGRLLRSKEDRGILAVMDGRLWRRGYGKRVMSALGDHPVLGSWEDLHAAAERLGVRALKE